MIEPPPERHPQLRDHWLQPHAHLDSAAVDGAEALIRISMFLGGWYLNTTIGMPYLPVPGQPQIQAILGSKNPNQAQAIALLKALILGTPGIIALEQFSVSVVPNPTGPQPANIFQGSFTAQMQGGQVVTVDLPGGP